MHRVKSLPQYLLDRYQEWKEHTFPESQEWFRQLAEKGQRPRAMVIACCDSRVAITSIFGQRTGELFVHRNIANLVPPYTPDGQHHGTGAAVQYAVETLKVQHILVMGHSHCGGVRGCIDMCSGKNDALLEKDSLVGRWLDVLRPGFDRVKDIEDASIREVALEKEGIQISLENLLGYPFVKRAVDDGRLTLHGIWADISDMGLETFDGAVRRFSHN
ncbi:Carbonic anhydrase [Roseibacterium elongatum DSM 19469]|uniref:Carbonic anhydrase n=1 Tax=Roseicyclus elongatus DSM 19469 TaxID=1294273 RepID=W8S491_9RHOB|nr:carbonic anhydrase [Roseibacterium elongatum]AHM03606.1 Carbonic anhydrase [Roseibacterium elongatum DSM 19469]